MDDRNFFLVHFAHQHLDFQIPELECVLEEHVAPEIFKTCKVHALPNQNIENLVSISSLDLIDSPSEGNDDWKNGSMEFKKYCKAVAVATEKSLKSQLYKNNITTTGDLSESKDEQPPEQNMKLLNLNNNYSMKRPNNRPFLILSFSSFDNKKTYESTSSILDAFSKCVLIKSVIELWSYSTSIEACAKNIETNYKHDHGESKRINRLVQEHCIDNNKSWKLTIYTFGSKYTREEQNQMRANFSFLPFTGAVIMKNPNEEFIMIREIEVNDLGSPLYPRHSNTKVIIPENDKIPPLGVYFGRIVVHSEKTIRNTIDNYALTKRKYLGPTSMDTELSMIMANLGRVKKGTFCFDPFVGTGSILLTCSLQGAFCFGTDIDIRVIRGTNKKNNLWSNFDQFNLVRPEIVRSDNSIFHRHYQLPSEKPMFDAIICDPPYGIRAGARQSGSRSSSPKPIMDHYRDDHIAQTKPYPVSDVMADLLDVSARSLVLGGRLVYIIPSMTDFDAANDLPRHECLELVHICYQPLQKFLGRRVVTMKKIKEYDPNRREEFYLPNIWVNGPESADKCANIREKLIEMARMKPDYEQKRDFRIKKRKAKQEEIKRQKQKKKQQEHDQENAETNEVEA